MKATITEQEVNGQPGFAINYTTAEGVTIEPWLFGNTVNRKAAFEYFRSVYVDATM